MLDISQFSSSHILDNSSGGDEDICEAEYSPPSKQALQLSHTEQASSDDSGVFIVDLDEGAFGIFVLFNYLRKIISGGSFDAVVQDLNEEAAQLSSAPQEWLSAQSSQTGMTDNIVAFSLSGMMLPLAAMAIKAGIEEIGEAVHKHEELTEKRTEIEKKLRSLQPSELNTTERVDEGIGLARSNATKIETQSLANIDSALEHNFYNGGIGCGALVSGTAIFTKVAQETALQVTTLAIAKTWALTAATTVIGTLGTVFFGPIAAFAAVALGGFFVHQARKVGDELEEDRRIINSVPLNLDECSETEQAYQAFIDRKFTSRENLAARFKRWNAGFLGGACLYALSASAKAAIGIAAMASVAAAVSNPIGLGVLLALGIIGGITMAVCSWQFLMLQGKSKKHQAYRLEESPFLGRRFDAIQTVHAMTLPGGSDTRVASSLRTSLYNFVFQRDSTRQNFLHSKAVEMGKFHAWEQRATDADATKDLVSKEKERYKNVLAFLSSVGTYLDSLFSNLYLATRVNSSEGNLFSDAHKAAFYEAQKAYALQADELTTFGLARWLQGNDSFGMLETDEQEQRSLLNDMLSKQADFLEEKLAAYEKFSPLFLNCEKLAPEIHQTFKKAMEEAEMDRSRLQRINVLLGNTFSVTLNCLKKQFLLIQGLDKAALPDENAETELNDRLAQYLIEGLSDELTTTRGILFDMHRRSFHLQARSEQ